MERVWVVCGRMFSWLQMLLWSNLDLQRTAQLQPLYWSGRTMMATCVSRFGIATHFLGKEACIASFRLDVKPISMLAEVYGEADPK